SRKGHYRDLLRKTLKKGYVKRAVWPSNPGKGRGGIRLLNDIKDSTVTQSIPAVTGPWPGLT
ncbi:MAG: hypothetical protein OR999_01945, partial [Arenicellales bacterium]|nr:hypothetical protein [Arenicellales bacterium]